MNFTRHLDCLARSLTELAGLLPQRATSAWRPVTEMLHLSWVTMWSHQGTSLRHLRQCILLRRWEFGAKLDWH